MDRDRFSKLWDRCADSPAGPIFSGLENSYNEEHRQYHTGDHIGHCLIQLDLGRDEMEHADAIEMALWFHDVEYDPKASDNELKSAERFRKLAKDVMEPALEQQIYRLIMVTTHHAPKTMDEKYVVDIDLSSFGLPWDKFMEDSNKVAAECSHLSQQEFAARNCRFLDSLLQRATIFSTEFYRERFENRARDNISRRLNFLRASVA